MGIADCRAHSRLEASADHVVDRHLEQGIGMHRSADSLLGCASVGSTGTWHRSIAYPGVTCRVRSRKGGARGWCHPSPPNGGARTVARLGPQPRPGKRTSMRPRPGSSVPRGRPRGSSGEHLPGQGSHRNARRMAGLVDALADLEPLTDSFQGLLRDAKEASHEDDGPSLPDALAIWFAKPLPPAPEGAH